MNIKPGHFLQCILILILVSICFGCGEDKPQERLTVIPVKGSVMVNGKTADGAKVTFHPISGSAAGTGLYPMGIANETGEFSITTYDTGDGIPKGEYKVTVVWPDKDFKPKTIEQIDAFEQGGERPDKLRGRFSDPKRSKLTATIDESTTVLPDFKLK